MKINVVKYPDECNPYNTDGVIWVNGNEYKWIIRDIVPDGSMVVLNSVSKEKIKDIFPDTLGEAILEYYDKAELGCNKIITSYKTFIRIMLDEPK